MIPGNVDVAIWNGMHAVIAAQNQSITIMSARMGLTRIGRHNDGKKASLGRLFLVFTGGDALKGVTAISDNIPPQSRASRNSSTVSERPFALSIIRFGPRKRMWIGSSDSFSIMANGILNRWAPKKFGSF
jgi:hypothetical protein